MHVNKLFLLSLFVLLTGCGTTQPVIRVVTQIVEVPVPVACKEEQPPVPDYCFNKLSDTADIYDKTKCLLSDRELNIGYNTVLTTKLNACK